MTAAIELLVRERGKVSIALYPAKGGGYGARVIAGASDQDADGSTVKGALLLAVAKVVADQRGLALLRLQQAESAAIAERETIAAIDELLMMEAE